MIQLSEQQQAAINHTGSPVLVVAGAGSGKTRTLIAKFSQLVQSGFDPKRILAITFTNKAASEMKSRILDDTNIKETNLPWVKTYHSACLSILKKYCNLVGLSKPIQIYTTYHQQKLIKGILTHFNLDKKYTNIILNHISNAKNTGSPKVYFDSQSKLSPIPLYEIYKLYEKKLFSRNAVDFDNILLLTRNLLRSNSEICGYYKKFFQYILFDEYQDTNNLNEDITGLLLNQKNFFAVGDDWQSIYSFRMSNINHFLSFHNKYPEAKFFRLEENYRSTNKIVQLGNRLISYNENKVEKFCYSKKEGGLIESLEFDNDSQEAEWVARTAKTISAMGTPYKKMAILYRTKFCSLPFEKSLRKKNIPYKMMGGRGFFERMEILDLNSYIASAVFEKDDVSFERIVNTPKRGIGTETLKKIAYMRKPNMSLQQAFQKAITEKILMSKPHNSLEKLFALLTEIKDMKPEKALRKVINDTNYINYLENYTKSNSMALTAKIENIEQLIYSGSQKVSIAEYLEEISLIKEDRKEANEEYDTGINLSTVHKTKGLEFQIVFIVGCEEGLFPHWKSMCTDKDIEEERRLMYVAVTRAKKYLFITSASFRKGQHSTKSRFLDELGITT